MSEDISVLWEYTFWELFFQSFFKHSQVEQIHVKKKKQPISNFFFECEDKHGEWGGGGGGGGSTFFYLDINLFPTVQRRYFYCGSLVLHVMSVRIRCSAL